MAQNGNVRYLLYNKGTLRMIKWRQNKEFQMFIIYAEGERQTQRKRLLIIFLQDYIYCHYILLTIFYRGTVIWQEKTVHFLEFNIIHNYK